MNNHISLIFLLSLLCSSHAVNAENNKHLKQPGLIPLSVGNTWSYINKQTGQRNKSSIVNVQRIGEKYWFQYNELGDIFWIRNEGLNQYEAINFSGSLKIYDNNPKEALVLRTDKPEYRFDGVDAAYYQMCEEPLKVEAGVFDCHRIKFVFGRAYSINYYAEDIGLIKNIYKTDKIEEFELESFTLK